MSCDDEHPAQELPSRDASVRRVAVSNTWSVLTEIVGEAWGMDQEGCQLYLDRACGEDGLLRAEAESLLAQQKTMGGFLKESAETEVLSLKVSIGQQVGPYRIEEEIGEGSTGVVFRATDLRLERIVALKILKPGDNRFTQHAARFVAEARTVAALN
ncbi:MAG TPA: hypothetical protein VHZ55_31805, partial [Bryobacteraceae bacterium]|nr:hypothetical protein [Bryobacteraceae bacterium]